MISIIIPTFNRAKILQETLPSYLRQKLVKEIIVVDDGSTDDTQEFLLKMQKKDKRITYLRHNSKKGQSTAKNIGLKHATGDYILFGEDDVLLDNDYTVHLINCLSRNDADIVAGRIILTDSFNSKIKSNKNKKPLIDTSLIGGNFDIKTEKDEKTVFLHSCFLAKAGVFKKISFDEEYKGNGFREETDIQVSAAKLGYKIFFCPHTKCFHLFKKMGGCREMNRFTFEYWTIRNNLYFLKKHYPFLKKELGLKEGMFKLMVRFSINRLLLHLIPSFLFIRRKS
jgi:glycosyltransferase involved in cell wall biosynthesis